MNQPGKAAVKYTEASFLARATRRRARATGRRDYAHCAHDAERTVSPGRKAALAIDDHDK